MSTVIVCHPSEYPRIGWIAQKVLLAVFSTIKDWIRQFTYSDADLGGHVEDLNRPRACFVVLDASPSMDDRDWPPTRLGAAQDAAKSFVRAVYESSPESRVAVIAYGSRAKVHCRLTPVTDYDAIFKAIDKISIIGSTNITAGLQAVGKLRERDNSLAQTIVLSDGHHNYGPSPTKIAESLKKWSVIETIGIGGRPQDVDEPLLKQIASKRPDGTPRYRWIGDRAALVHHFRQLGGGLTRE